MPGSYKRVNYDLRPAKHAERMMMVEALRRVECIATLQAYRYVGLGSAFFADLRLVHTALGLNELISIEAEVQDSKRLEFNKPFACIEMQYGHSSEVLPSLDWSGLNIVWMDYDGPLGMSVLADVQHLASVLRPGSVLIVSVNAAPGELEGRSARVRERLADALPLGETDNSLGSWGLARVSHAVLRDTIAEAMRTRSLGSGGAAKVRFEQIFNFQYRDGPQMLTVGGLIVDTAIEHHFAACNFMKFDYYRPDQESFRIEAPNLTVTEMSFLDHRLPANEIADADFLPGKDVSRYKSLYRYLPEYRSITRA